MRSTRGESGSGESYVAWTVDSKSEHRCIYRVPFLIFEGYPKGYMPMMVLIGPLHHGLRLKAKATRDNSIFMDLDTTESRYLGYSETERYKDMYMAGFTTRVGREKVEELKNIVAEEEENIRESYAESTACIQSRDFVGMIFLDSVFILELILRFHEKQRGMGETEDRLMDNRSSDHTVRRDLTLLENQLPYFILEKLFRVAKARLSHKPSLRQLVLEFFSFTGDISDDTEFKHFTDMARCVFMETLDLTPEEKKVREPYIGPKYNADKLDSAGVKFKLSNTEDAFSMEVKFERGILYLPLLYANPGVLLLMRNIMAFEQCHYPHETYVCSYMLFWNSLIDNDKDVELLAQAGVVLNEIEDETVAKVVNKLDIGIVEHTFYYGDIAESLHKHYENRFNRSCAKLRRVYFTDLWTGTATVAATLLLLLTLIQTVASVIQVLQSQSSPPP